MLLARHALTQNAATPSHSRHARSAAHHRRGGAGALLRDVLLRTGAEWRVWRASLTGEVMQVSLVSSSHTLIPTHCDPGLMLHMSIFLKCGCEFPVFRV